MDVDEDAQDVEESAMKKQRQEAEGEHDAASTDGISDVAFDEILSQDAKKSVSAKRRLRRRSTEEQSARVLTNQLRGMSESDKYVKKIDDLTLWERINQDRRQARLEKRHLGSSYYKGLANMYGSMCFGATDLLMTDDDRALPIRPRLLKAIKAANMANTTLRSRQDLLDWLRDESQEIPNPRE